MPTTGQCYEQAGYDRSLMETSCEHESATQAFGDGGGCLIRALTSEGCILGSAAVLHPKREPSDIAQEAAEELVQDLADGGCADRWCVPLPSPYSPLRGPSIVFEILGVASFGNPLWPAMACLDQSHLPDMYSVLYLPTLVV